MQIVKSVAQWTVAIVGTLFLAAFCAGLVGLLDNVSFEWTQPGIRTAQAYVNTMQEMWNGVYNAAYGTTTGVGSLNVTVSDDILYTETTMTGIIRDTENFVVGAADITSIRFFAVTAPSYVAIYDSPSTAGHGVLINKIGAAVTNTSVQQTFDPPLRALLGVFVDQGGDAQHRGDVYLDTRP